LAIIDIADREVVQDAIDRANNTLELLNIVDDLKYNVESRVDEASETLVEAKKIECDANENLRSCNSLVDRANYVVGKCEERKTQAQEELARAEFNLSIARQRLGEGERILEETKQRRLSLESDERRAEFDVAAAESALAAAIEEEAAEKRRQEEEQRRRNAANNQKLRDEAA